MITPLETAYILVLVLFIWFLIGPPHKNQKRYYIWVALEISIVGLCTLNFLDYLGVITL